MPVILSDTEEKKWINPGTELSHITSMLNPYASKLMTAYPIDPKIKNSLHNDKQLIQPIGVKALSEEENQGIQRTSYQEYYRSKKQLEFDDTRPSWVKYYLKKSK